MEYKGSILEAFNLGGGSQGEYKGKHINRYFVIDKPGYYCLNFKIEKTDSPYLQCIVFELCDFNEGEIYIDGNLIKKKKRRFPKFGIWEDEMSKEFVMYVNLQQGKLSICNGLTSIFTIKDYCTTQIHGMAMIIEQIDNNHYRFCCNDLAPDDDFDDFVFCLKIAEFADEQKWTKLARRQGDGSLVPFQ